jgi:hypothetical protein
MIRSVATSTGSHALRRRGREPGAHKLDHLLDREAVRHHQRLGAAVMAGGEQVRARGQAIGPGGVAPMAKRASAVSVSASMRNL